MVFSRRSLAKNARFFGDRLRGIRGLLLLAKLRGEGGRRRSLVLALVREREQRRSVMPISNYSSRYSRLKADTPMAHLCYLGGGWKSPLTVMTVYQQADQVTMRNALTNRDHRRAIGAR